MDSFIGGWAPVSQWPKKDRVSVVQVKAALSAPATRVPFDQWRKDFEKLSTGLRGPNISKDRILHLAREELIEFSDYYPPDKWTPELLIARLIHRLYRLHKLHSVGLFHGREVDDRIVMEAFFALFLEVKRNFSPTKRAKSALYGAIFPTAEIREDDAKSDSPDHSRPDTPPKDSNEMDVDVQELPDVGGAITPAKEQIFRGGWPDLTGNEDAHVSLVMKVHELNDEAKALHERLTAYPATEKRQGLIDSIASALQPGIPSTCSFGLPSVWSGGYSIAEACRLLSIENKEPYYLEHTPVSQRLKKHQVQGIAFIQERLLAFQKVALLDWTGFGKTRQVLLGLERALRKFPRTEKPSLIVVPSGGIGEQWIGEGLASTISLSFVAVGGSFSGVHESPRVRYLKTSEYEIGSIGKDRFTIVLCTNSTLRKLVTEKRSSMVAVFHAVAIDEMQVLRKWKGSATFLAIDELQSTWRIGLTATPLMNGLPDMKGFLAFFRNKVLDMSKVRKNFDKYGSPYKDDSRNAFYRALPESWERFVEGSDFHEQADALAKVASQMIFVISRDNETRDATGARVGPPFPPLLLSRQTVGFTDREAKKAYVKEFNKILDCLWVTYDGRKRMRLDQLTELATLTLSPFAVKVPADQTKVAKFNLEGSTLAEICEAVLGHPVSDQQALEEVRSPKLEWLASFIASVVVQRREKVLLFVLNNREQLLVRAFVEALGVRTANYHAKLSSGERELMMQTFNKDGGPPVFVTTWEMGAVGFNMQHQCCVVVAMSLYYNKNAEVQGRARIHRPGQKRPVLYIQCRQAPSLDTVFLLKHADRKESAELYARLQLAKEDSELLEKLFGEVSKATGGDSEGGDIGEVVKSDLSGEADMPGKTMELFQSILARDAVPYTKTLEHLEV